MSENFVKITSDRYAGVAILRHAWTRLFLIHGVHYTILQEKSAIFSGIGNTPVNVIWLEQWYLNDSHALGSHINYREPTDINSSSHQSLKFIATEFPIFGNPG